MPKPKQQEEVTTKRKLRTAADVISRLRWASDDKNDGATVLIGYDDRINGPMEKAVQDYVRIDQGGDIPEHRIQYFRRDDSNKDPSSSVLWDRSARVDRVFGSGEGADAPISPSTRAQVVEAIANMKRLEQEKNERRAQKDKERARRSRQRARKAAVLQQPHTNNNAGTRSSDGTCQLTNKRDRYTWTPVDWYSYSDEAKKEWEASVQNVLPREESEKPNSVGTTGELAVVTWNVLFDLYDDELTSDITPVQVNDRHCGDDDGGTMARWELLADCLEGAKADLVALQEVTPKFVTLLLSQPWVKSKYCSSAAPFSVDTVDPTGTLLLWKKHKLRVSNKGIHGLSVLEDGPRKRSLVAVLEFVHDPSHVILCANVHLPADKQGEADSRALARQRELGTVLGQLQTVEKTLLDMRSNMHLIPIIAGDFNTDQDILQTDFIDAWPLVSHGMRSFTFDPETNTRAARSRALTKSTRGPRTIDRIQIAKYPNTEKEMPLEPFSGSLIGVANDSDMPVPPSDHYGLLMSFRIAATKPQAILHSPVGLNVWAANAISTPDTLLALVLDENVGAEMQLFDQRSSLPLPHITLLHGFVELECEESRCLAVQAVQNSIQLALDSNLTEWSLTFHENSLSVFEHRNSATLVCLPDTEGEKGAWLFRLYDTLRTTFRLCREQERRFQEGWTPHLTVGNFGTAAAARSEAKSIRSQGKWFDGKQKVAVQSVGIYQRDTSDGKFYLVSTVPFLPGPKRINQGDTRDFLKDAGTRLSCCMRGVCTPILLDIERACQNAVASKSSGQLDTRIQVYGSHAMNASLPTLSDVDAVIQIRPTIHASNPDQLLRSLQRKELLLDVASRLKTRYRNCKARMRLALAGDVDLYILTVKIWARAPSIDMQLCLMNSDGKPLDKKSSIAHEATMDTAAILEIARKCSPFLPKNLDAVAVFEGALRIVKLWAHRRQVYGSSSGYLGGGGWAITLVRVMYDGFHDHKIIIPEDTPHGQASALVVAHLFNVASKWTHPILITLPVASMVKEVDIQDGVDRALKRGTIAVLTPASGGDFGRSTTPSTVHTIMNELHRATAVLASSQSVEIGMKSVVEPQGLEEFLATFPAVLVVEIGIPDSANTSGLPLAADVKAWGHSHVLGVVVALEHQVGDVSRVRLLAKPIRTRGCFNFMIIVDEIPQELAPFASTRSKILNADMTGFFGSISTNRGSVLCLSSEDALNRFMPSTKCGEQKSD